MDDTTWEIIRGILTLLLGQFGRWGTLGLVVLLLVAAAAWRYYKDRRADKAMDQLVAEKERTIQRIAGQERSWRKLFLTVGVKVSAEEADKLLQLEGNYNDAEEARAAVERKRS